MALGNLKNRSKRFSPPKLMLTSMMDMFTITLIFLLFSFSEESNKLQITKDLELPNSSAQTSYSDSIQIVLSKKELRLNDEVVAVLDEKFFFGFDPNNPEASLIFQRLKSMREKEINSKNTVNPDSHVLFLCDRHHSFKTINAVIKTAGMAGYPNFQFAVLEGRRD